MQSITTSSVERRILHLRIFFSILFSFSYKLIWVTIWYIFKKITQCAWSCTGTLSSSVYNIPVEGDIEYEHVIRKWTCVQIQPRERVEGTCWIILQSIFVRHPQSQGRQSFSHWIWRWLLSQHNVSDGHSHKLIKPSYSANDFSICHPERLVIVFRYHL